MNTTTIGNIPSKSNWKRIKGQYVAAAVGFALALSAVATFSSNADQAAKPQTISSRSSIPVAATRGVDTPHSYFFIVGDATQKAQLDAADSELRSFYPKRNNITVLVAGSPAAEALQGEGVRELMAIGAPFTISDTTVPVQASGADVTRRASDADIMAGVISSELANYMAPAQPMSSALDAERAALVTAQEQIMAGVTSRAASDADIMNSVISTERVAFGE